jgi:hypothetical protein
MFEHRHEPVLPLAAFLRRVARFVVLDLIVILAALALGVLGYHYFEGLGWIDALLNASMILGGMGPVNALQTTAGKLFASFYALVHPVRPSLAASISFRPRLGGFRQ